MVEIMLHLYNASFVIHTLGCCTSYSTGHMNVFGRSIIPGVLPLQCQYIKSFKRVNDMNKSD